MPLPRDIYQRRYASCAALLGWAALAAQLYLIVTLRFAQGASFIGGIVNFLSFFTILTNLLAACALTLPWVARTPPAADFKAGYKTPFLARPGVLTGIATSIALVGIVYSLLLRQLWQPQGLQWVANELLHDVMPIVFLLYWWLFVPPGRLRGRDIVNWAAYPVLYFVYALLRGAWFGPYPYPFIDVGVLGYARVATNAMLVLLAFVTLASVLVGLDQVKPAR
jgi:hypothetical protein